jgi:hypothetical protein
LRIEFGWKTTKRRGGIFEEEADLERKTRRRGGSKSKGHHWRCARRITNPLGHMKYLDERSTCQKAELPEGYKNAV